jgi:hypothetical protein
MKKSILLSSILSVIFLVSCNLSTVSSESISTSSNSNSEEIVSSVISEESNDELDLWLQAYDIMREPTQEELLLSPEINITPKRIMISEFSIGENESKETSFEYMEDNSFNGFSSEHSDPESRAYALIIYFDGLFYTSSGIGIGVTKWAGFSSSVDLVINVITVEVFINYSVTNNSTLDPNDIVTVKVAEFEFQYAYIN